MAQRIGKCTNYSGCKLAYRNEKITVVTKEFRCPECGSPLESLGPKRGLSPTLVLSIGVAIVLLLAVGAILWTLGGSPKRRPKWWNYRRLPLRLRLPPPLPLQRPHRHRPLLQPRLQPRPWSDCRAHSGRGNFRDTDRSRRYFARDRRSEARGPETHRPDAKRLCPK